MDYLIRKTSEPRMGPILENVSYLLQSFFIQRNYLTNKYSHFKEMRS